MTTQTPPEELPEGRHGYQDPLITAGKIDAAQETYAKSPKGRVSRKKWNASDAAKAASKRYQDTEKGKLAFTRYQKSKKAKKARLKRAGENKHLLKLLALMKEREAKSLCTFCGSAKHKSEKHPAKAAKKPRKR